MDRAAFEHALAEIDALLARDDVPEQEFQEWFERHPIVFTALSYLRFLPHPVITDTDGGEWIPDFLVERPNRDWIIFEIKRADARILPEGERRRTFYSDIHKYVAQCFEYKEQLDEAVVRDAFRARYDVPIHKDPDIILVVGRSANLDREIVRSISKRQGITLLTYDDVRSTLDQARAFYFASYDSASGYSWISVGRIDRPPEPYVSNRLFDIGAAPGRDRVSIFVNPEGYLRITLWDSTGVRRDTRSIVPLTDKDFGSVHSILFSFGRSDTFAFVSVEIDRRFIADIRVEPFPFTLSRDMAIGTSFTALGAGWFALATMMAVNGLLTLEQKAAVDRYAYNSVMEIEQGARALIALRGREALWTESHPNRAVFEATFPDSTITWGDARNFEGVPVLRGGRRIG